MDRGGRATFLLALVPFAAAVWAATRGMPASAAEIVAVLPELLVAPIAVLALRFGSHRALVAGLVVVAVHRVPVPDAAVPRTNDTEQTARRRTLIGGEDRSRMSPTLARSP